MELTSPMKMARFQTFWIQMRKNKPLDESRKSGKTSRTKMTFYSKIYFTIIIILSLKKQFSRLRMSFNMLTHFPLLRTVTRQNPNGSKLTHLLSSIPSEPVILELPELKGHARRDYWLAIVREVLYAHRFIRKYRITGVERDEALLKAVFGILRIQALSNMNSIVPLCYEAGLMYNACDQLPGGDRILETIATMLTSKETQKNNTKSGDGMHSVSATTMASSLGFVFGTNSNMPKQSLINVGEITVGEMTPLEKAVEESRSSYKMVADAQATVDGAKVEGLDTNLAVLKVCKQ
ncbi:hypothetical protein Hanom_Chr11g01002551 [Helianthus anomalus]